MVHVLVSAGALIVFGGGSAAAQSEADAGDQAAITPSVAVGSKTFTESVVLGEIATQLVRTGGARAQHRQALGGTRILWEALLLGEIDIYPDYTGTIRKEILSSMALQSDGQLTAALAEFGVRMTRSLGFNNTYQIGMRSMQAKNLGLRNISDLVNHPDLRVGFSNEFVDRADGWPGLRDRYGLPHRDVRGMDHDLAYTALAGSSVDVIDVYATDARIHQFGIHLLHDDLRHFPVYDAVFLYREDLADRSADAIAALRKIEGRIDEDLMTRMNALVTIDGHPEARVASDFLKSELALNTSVAVVTRPERIWQRTREHLTLVVISLTAAMIVAIPLGVLSVRRPRIGQVVLGIVGVIQTIPSLALLVILVKPLGSVGSPPAIVALFLYSLLPLVRNTHAGLRSVAPELLESADALGLPKGTRLRLIELPIAARTILAGVKTAAVINIGFATLGALIGAGGYGQPILTGIRLNSYPLILEGAVPAAVLALLVQGIFEIAEKAVVSRGLKIHR
jgi:osmoprotectant transport system permease protein